MNGQYKVIGAVTTIKEATLFISSLSKVEEISYLQMYLILRASCNIEDKDISIGWSFSVLSLYYNSNTGFFASGCHGAGRQK